MSDAVVLASGGINSTVAAVRARTGGAVVLLHADYGQPSSAGQRAAVRALADAIDATSFVVELPHIPKILSAKRNQAGKLTVDPRSAPTIGMASQTPALSVALLSAGLQLAFRVGAEAVISGTSEAANEIETESAPGAGTPDHRREFFYFAGAMFDQLQRSRKPIRIETPLIDLSRAEIIQLGHRDCVPFDLTYSCRAARDVPCNECPSCIARAKAFTAAKLIDPAMTAAQG